MNIDPLVSPQLRIGIFVVAYNSSSTIYNVLDRISPAIWEMIVEVYIFDDSSEDDTPLEIDKFIKDKNYKKIKFFRNQVNLKYGGNQKRGFRYAINKNFDVLVLLHADGKYAPEVIGQLIDPILNDKSDISLGSRLLIKGEALKNGMPFYKYIGNIFLTRFGNIVLGTNFTDLHSGFRAYRVSALQQIPFLKNSNDYHFDNEIIIQLVAKKFRTIDVPIPTYYGQEIRNVKGIHYAINSILAALRYLFHSLGFYCDSSFDFSDGQQYVFKNNRYSSHRQILDILKQFAGTRSINVLDIGCGAGFLAKKIAQMGHRVFGVDIYENDEARLNCDEFHVVDVRQSFGIEENRKFDCIVLADIIEHASTSEDIMLRARKHLTPDGIIIASTGNVANILIRLMLLLGFFHYTTRGILDKTHCRLFTKHSIKKLFLKCGFDVIKQTFTPIPFECIIPNSSISNTLSFINYLLARLWPSMFSYQCLITGKLNNIPTELIRETEILRNDFQ